MGINDVIAILMSRVNSYTDFSHDVLAIIVRMATLQGREQLCGDLYVIAGYVSFDTGMESVIIRVLTA